MLVQPTQSCVDRVAFLWATMVSQCDMVRCIVALFGTVDCDPVSLNIVALSDLNSSMLRMASSIVESSMPSIDASNAAAKG